ncbi:MAG: ABC transporter permease [Desulfobacula sp.]|uniref:ABC transporter permease n=1 Tax=Desulfobacula sp. TaxID=2593537 RepID=UPI0025BE833F|nr:ABC transporter permease [Desulfobacula sp.]MCD4721309.1 ABC transporter permease [Desulfobacula sp.]
MNKNLYKILHQTNLMVGGIITLFVITAAIFAPVLAPYHPIDDADLMVSEEPPGKPYWFGTDIQGRDILSRVIYGARISLAVGLISQVFNTIIGVSLGLSAGFFGGWWDDLVMGLTNIMLSIPSLIFALAVMALLGPGLINVFIALGFTNWSYSCPITRSQALAAKNLDYVKAARALGYGRIRLMFTQILPNIIGPILIIATLGVAGAILLEAALSFLGLGVQPPTPSWGAMLSAAREQLFTAPWISVFPGLAIFITVLGLNLLGDGLRDILDPHTLTQRN